MTTPAHPCLALRCDADAAMGFGHFYRQLALAQHAIDSGWRVLMCTHESLPKQLTKLAHAEGVAIHFTSSERGSIQEASDVRELLASEGVHALVVDGYHLSEAYVDALHGPSKVVFFEDDGTRRARAHLVVNMSPGSEHVDYTSLPGEPRFALGPGYALLRRQFLTKRPERASAPDQVERVLITLGGGDMTAEISCALRGLHMAGFTQQCDVMVGSLEDTQRAALHALCRDDLGFDVTLHQGVQDVAGLMAAQHMAICAAGGTSWELANLGVPMLQVELFDNQRLIAEYFRDHGISSWLGKRAHFEPEHIAERSSALIQDHTQRLKMAQRARQLVDGQGALRLLAICKEL